MARFRFVHAADLHLDTPFTGLARLGESLPERLRDASLQAFDNLVAATLESEADLLVLAGDLHDGPDRGLRAQLRLRDGLKRLDEAGIQVAIVHGNHDPVEEGWSAIDAWPGNVTVFPPDDLASVPLHRDGRELARIYGISYARRETRANLARRFPTERESAFAIGVLHANVGGNAEHAAYAPCELADLRAAAIDYWALGHIHRHAILTDGQPWAVYPGVLQGRSPKPSEQGAKGAVIVDVADNQVRAVTFRELDVVRFESRELDIAGLADLGALQDRLQAAAEAAVDKAGGRPLILRARLTGRGPVHGALRRGGGTEELVAALQEGAGGAARVWWDRITDATAPPLDLDAIRQRGDVSAALVDRVAALQADPEARVAFFKRHAHSGSDRRLRPFVAGDDPDAAESAALEAALYEALDRLEPEDGA